MKCNPSNTCSEYYFIEQIFVKLFINTNLKGFMGIYFCSFTTVIKVFLISSMAISINKIFETC